jgi:hypothetical protein
MPHSLRRLQGKEEEIASGNVATLTPVALNLKLSPILKISLKISQSLRGTR